MIRSATPGPHKYSCVMLVMPDDIAKRMESFQKKIKESDLAGDGLETEYHITVKYGLISNELTEVKGAFPKEPVEVELGKVSRFDTAEDFDVIKIEVFGDSLFESHLELSELPNEDSHAGFFKGHATLAYVKKGACSELDGDDEFSGERVMLDTLIWSPASGEKQEIKLGQKKEASRYAATEQILVDIDSDLEDGARKAGLSVLGLVKFLGKVIDQHLVPGMAKRLNVSEQQIKELVGQLTWSIEAPPVISDNTSAGYGSDAVTININFLATALLNDNPRMLLGTLIHELEHWFYDILVKVPTSNVAPLKKKYDSDSDKEVLNVDWMGSKGEQVADIAKYRELLAVGYSEQELIDKVKPEYQNWVRWIIEIAKDTDPQTVVSNRSGWLRRAEEEELVDFDPQHDEDFPQDDDIFIEQRGDKYRAFQNRSQIVAADDRDLLELAIYKYMERSKFFPNVWEDGNLYRLEPLEKLRNDLAARAQDEIIAGLEYFGPEPVGSDDLIENIDRAFRMYDYQDELKLIFNIAIKQLASEGKVRQHGDGWIIPPKPSALSDFNPASLPTMRPQDKQISTDNLLDQYGDASPEERQMLEQRMRELNASRGRWLRVEADLAARIPILTKQFLSKYPPEVAEEKIRWANSADPSGDEAKYTAWILKNWLRGEITLSNEQTAGMQQLLGIFDKIKNVKGFPSELKDINRLRFRDVADAVEKYEHLRPKNEQERELINMGQKVVYSDSAGKIIEITTPEAAAELCRDTGWCVKDPRYSKRYLEKGPLYMIINDEGNGPAPGPVALVHPATNDVKNVDDNDLDPNMWQELSQIDFPPIKEAMDNVPKQWSTEDKYHAYLGGLSLAELGVDGSDLIEFIAMIDTGNQEDNHRERQVLEHELLEFPRDAISYAADCGYVRWPALEQKILQGGLPIEQAAALASRYANKVLGHRWPQAEFLFSEYASFDQNNPDASLPAEQLRQTYERNFPGIIPLWMQPIREENPDKGDPIPGDPEEDTYQPPQMTPMEWVNEEGGKQPELALQSWLRHI